MKRDNLPILVTIILFINCIMCGINMVLNDLIILKIVFIIVLICLVGAIICVAKTKKLLNLQNKISEIGSKKFSMQYSKNSKMTKKKIYLFNISTNQT